METIKERIIAHSAELFVKKGCKTITMDDIATSMGISKRTIYENFADKKELLAACLGYFFENQNLRIKSVLKSSDNIIDAMYKQMENNYKIMAQVKFDFFGEIRKYYPKVYEDTVKTFKQQALQNSIDVLQKGQQDGVIKSDINAQVVAIIMHEVMGMILLSDVFDIYNVSKMELLLAGYVITRGAATTKGIKLIDNYVEDYRKNTKM